MYYYYYYYYHYLYRRMGMARTGGLCILDIQAAHGTLFILYSK